MEEYEHKVTKKVISRFAFNQLVYSEKKNYNAIDRTTFRSPVEDTSLSDVVSLGSCIASLFSGSPDSGSSSDYSPSTDSSPSFDSGGGDFGGGGSSGDW